MGSRCILQDAVRPAAREWARTVDYFPEDFPGGGPDGMTSPGQEGKVVAVLAEELNKLDVRYTVHAKVAGRDNLLATVGKGLPGYRKMLVLLHTDVVPSGAPSAWGCRT